VIVIATGSEVALAIEAAATLAQQNIAVRVVSMPSVNRFALQPASYRESVLPAAITKRIVIEAGATGAWYQYIGLEGIAIGLDHFGESAPAPELYRAFGITAQRVIDSALQMLGKR